VRRTGPLAYLVGGRPAGAAAGGGRLSKT
jgi:hypothetical protein